MRDNNDWILQFDGEHSVPVSQGEDGGAILQRNAGGEETYQG